MKKGEIYVEITNEGERLRAIEILKNAGEKLGDTELLQGYAILKQCHIFKDWFIGFKTEELTKITLDQLEALLKPKQSNLFVEVQEWIRENRPNFTITFLQDENPECFDKLKEHLQNDYPKGTEIKISANEILIRNNQL